MSMIIDPATDLAHALDKIARTKGAPAAIAMAEAMICAGAAVLINEHGGRFAYGCIQRLADDIALRVIPDRSCGNE